MIHGAHVILYSRDAEADRAFFRDVLKYRSADAGGGWLIFALPPAEIAIHPDDDNGAHELYLMCDDVDALIAEMNANGIPCEPVAQQPWGALTYLTLPGGGKLGVYQPRHASPIEKAAKAKAKPKAKSRAKAKAKPRAKAAKKKPARRRG